tara:strand:+ start:22 stop:741 length:720 start_codon:yes stop_codon:yes gene_type:complete
MAFKMKNPGLGQKAKAAGSPHKFGIAGEFKGQDSVSRGRKAIGSDGSPAKKKDEKDLSMAVAGSKAAKKAERKERKTTKKAEKQRKKDVKKFGGEENLAAYEGKKAAQQEKKKQYRLDKATNKYDDQGKLISRGLAEQGKVYNVQDESGEVSRATSQRASVEAEQKRQGTFKPQTGAMSRETMKRREANKGKTAEQHAQEAKDYFDNKRAKRETGESEAPLTKKKSALKNYKKGYYGVK